MGSFVGPLLFFKTKIGSPWGGLWGPVGLPRGSLGSFCGALGRPLWGLLGVPWESLGIPCGNTNMPGGNAVGFPPLCGFLGPPWSPWVVLWGFRGSLGVLGGPCGALRYPWESFDPQVGWGGEVAKTPHGS